MDGEPGDIWLWLVGLVVIIGIFWIISLASPDGNPSGRDCRPEEGFMGEQVVICETTE